MPFGNKDTSIIVMFSNVCWARCLMLLSWKWRIHFAVEKYFQMEIAASSQSHRLYAYSYVLIRARNLTMERLAKAIILLRRKKTRKYPADSLGGTRVINRPSSFCILHAQKNGGKLLLSFSASREQYDEQKLQSWTMREREQWKLLSVRGKKENEKL